MSFLTQTKGNFTEIVIITLIFQKIVNFVRLKLAKMAEICDHNIDPESSS
jgi:hypothetical protein